MNKIKVALGERSYDMLVGHEVLGTLGSIVQEAAPASKQFFVVDKNVAQTHGAQAMQSFKKGSDVFSIDAVETNKVMHTVEAIWSSMLAAGCDRGTNCIAIGGGLTGDIGGFAAASFMRGVPLVQVPTTLLAMVDASIGGKTGVNIALPTADGESVLGKNLAGAFWQPKVVVADVAVLKTLDDRQLRCGLAECVKHAMLGHDAMACILEDKTDAIFARDAGTLVELVTMSAQIKADVVAEDECEAGCRALLNLGHTFAHAIEPISELGLFHGEAVSIGLVAAVACAEACGLVDGVQGDKLRCLLSKLGLPTRLPMPVNIDRLLELMRMDKKSINAKIRLVLPTKDGAEIVDNVDDSAIILAWTSVGATL
ncbi:MAG: 3-dehydroquinate synthase [Phycisphaerales bacterium]|jgi:3-dehydroquinate synthase